MVSTQLQKIKELGEINKLNPPTPWGLQACGIVVCPLAPPVVLPRVVRQCDPSSLKCLTRTLHTTVGVHGFPMHRHCRIACPVAPGTPPRCTFGAQRRP